MTAHTLTQWTPEDRSEIVDLWTKGLTAQEVANIVSQKRRQNVSRNSILGIIHRSSAWKMRAPRKPGPPRRRPPDAKKKAAPKPRSKVAPAPPAASPPREDRGKVPLNDLGAFDCRFPVEEIASSRFLFCGEHVGYDADTSYCQEHKAICYRPLKSASDG